MAIPLRKNARIYQIFAIKMLRYHIWAMNMKIAKIYIMSDS